MPSIVLDSLEHPLLAPYRDIRHRDPVDEGLRFIAEGRLVVERLLVSRYRCESVLVQREHHRDLVDRALDRDPSTVIYEAELGVLRSLVGFDFHRGILACGVRDPLPTVDSLRPESGAPVGTARPTTCLVVCGVNNPENIGGLMRTAAAFGVSRMAMARDVADPFSRRALRVSMAAALRLEILMLEDPAADVRFLNRELGYRTVASTLADGAVSILDFRQDGSPLAILVGSEGDGLPAEVQRAATDRVMIPMRLGTDSLNVNVATAIFLFQLCGTHAS